MLCSPIYVKGKMENCHISLWIERQLEILLRRGRVMPRDTHINVFIGLSSVLRFFFCLRDSFVAGYCWWWVGWMLHAYVHMRK